jgi:O-acetyl-ADP-ribose deacetylase (regulator of RNase III)
MACIYLWIFVYRTGDISRLSVDAIVNSTNESLTERNPVSDRICARAGPAFKEEIQQEVKGKWVLGLWLITPFYK